VKPKQHDSLDYLQTETAQSILVPHASSSYVNDYNLKKSKSRMENYYQASYLASGKRSISVQRGGERSHYLAGVPVPNQREKFESLMKCTWDHKLQSLQNQVDSLRTQQERMFKVKTHQG